VLERRTAELKTLERDTTKLEASAKTPYPRISYDEAIERLKRRARSHWGDDFGGDEETALSEEFEIGRLWCIDTRPRAKPLHEARPDASRRRLCVDMLAPKVTAK